MSGNNGNLVPIPCGAKRQDGQPCQNPPVRNSKRCRFHGGATPKGVDSPHFKTGRHCSQLKKLGSDVYDALSDPELMDMRRAIAYRDTLLLRAAKRAEDADTPDFRKQATAMHAEAVNALREGDADAAWETMSNLGALLRRGMSEDRSLVDLSEQVKRLVTEQSAAWGVALSARNAFSSEDFRVILLGVIGALEEQGIPKADVMAAMATVDMNFFDGRFGFAHAVRRRQRRKGFGDEAEEGGRIIDQ